jgi:electron transport complex protein RnfG
VTWRPALGAGERAATPARDARREITRIALTMTVASALGAAVLGGVYLATHRAQSAAESAAESRAITELLGLGAGATVTEVAESLSPNGRQVVYEARAFGGAPGTGRRVAFSLDGRPEPQEAETSERGSGGHGGLPLGRLFVARRAGHTAGFVVEGTTRGYRNMVRFLVALDPEFAIAGVRVIEHEEDPGLGAEVATPVFCGQFIGRSAAAVAGLDVTRDPLPEDWHAALAELQRTPVAPWRAGHAALVEREGRRPIYAVTGATISSRALTDGVRITVDHFRRRWQLLAPYLEGGA